MKKLTCHCGGVEIEISLPDGLKILLDVTVHFARGVVL